MAVPCRFGAARRTVPVSAACATPHRYESTETSGRLARAEASRRLQQRRRQSRCFSEKRVWLSWWEVSFNALRVVPLRYDYKGKPARSHLCHGGVTKITLADRVWVRERRCNPA